VALPVFKTGLAGIAPAGGFDSLPPPPATPSRDPPRRGMRRIALGDPQASGAAGIGAGGATWIS